MNKEGYWQSEAEPDLPIPQVQEAVWKGQCSFLGALGAVEAMAETGGHVTVYRGFSICRICGIANGSTEYNFKDWKWPGGYKHYIVAHNIYPSTAFRDFILQAAGKAGVIADMPPDSKLTTEEKTTLNYLAEAWNAYNRLTGIDRDALDEFRRGIHACQHIIALRVAQRADPNVWRKFL